MCCFELLCGGAWVSEGLGVGLGLEVGTGCAGLEVVLGDDGILDWVSPFTWSSSATARKELSSS